MIAAMPTPTTPLVHADGVSKWYGQVSGLNNVTVSVPPGITGLLGPNGAGKSTFMKLMTGQLKPSQGAIRVLGEPIWGNPAIFARIGFCPEQDAFYDRITGLEWVTALVRLNGMDNAAADAAAPSRSRTRRGPGALATTPPSTGATQSAGTTIPMSDGGREMAASSRSASSRSAWRPGSSSPAWGWPSPAPGGWSRR